MSPDASLNVCAGGVRENLNEFYRWSDVDTEQIVELIHKFKNSQSPDVYGMSIMVLKYVVDAIATHLAFVINLCLKTGVFPGVLKHSRTVPVFKKGNPESIASYRPISIIPALAKVFEAVMKIQLVNHFERNNLFTHSQHGFRKNKSTVSAMLQLISNVLDAFEEKSSVALILADLSKAFDCVSHEILLKKMERYGVRGEVHQVFGSYLSGRTQVIAVKGATSSPLLIKHGVPQGSVIGPVLFLVLINDLSELGDLVLFADDTTILSKGATPETAVAGANDIFSEVGEWFSVNRLKLNVDKTQEMVCTLSHTVSSHIKTVKLLGFTLDPKLLWNQHIMGVCTKLARVIFLLRKLRTLLTVEHLVMIYHGLFHSHLSYGLLLWGHAAGCSAVLRLQKRALRIISRSGYLDHCRPIFIKLGILTIYSNYILLSLMDVKSNVASLPTRADNCVYELRQRGNLDIPYCRLSKTKDCYPVLALRMYNALPAVVRSLHPRAFKLKMKNWLISRPFYSLEEFFSCAYEII